MQMPAAAMLHCFTRAGWKSSNGVIVEIFLTTGAGMLSLSYVCKDARKLLSLTIFFDGVHQSSTIFPSPSFTRPGLIAFMMHTAWSTSLTGAGGLPIALISPMSLAVRTSNAPSASFNAGIASARSASTSAFCASAFSAVADAAASSTATASFSLAVFSDSALTTTIISSTSTFFAASFGCNAINSSFIPATDCSVVRIFSRPFSYLSFRSLTCRRLAASNILKVVISSKNEVGVA
mmetsp:Transcript_78624/g.217372  ORF Transcript_78624/g.217372 Transcript_78624/m.217372 type:complete len:236 (+) Transcript_78624:4033-4740(+)